MIKKTAPDQGLGIPVYLPSGKAAAMCIPCERRDNPLITEGNAFRLPVKCCDKILGEPLPESPDPDDCAGERPEMVVADRDPDVWTFSRTSPGMVVFNIYGSRFEVMQ